MWDSVFVHVNWQHDFASKQKCQFLGVFLNFGKCLWKYKVSTCYRQDSSKDKQLNIKFGLLSNISV